MAGRAGGYDRGMRAFIVLIIVLLLAAGGVYVVAGRAAGPSIDIRSPDRVAGRTTPVDVVVEAPEGRLASLEVTFEQNGLRTRVYGSAAPGAASSTTPAGAVTTEPPNRVHVTVPLSAVSGLAMKSGEAQVIVTASRPVLFGLRTVERTVSKTVQVRLEPPTVSILSTKHYINLGGSEMVVYRATPADVESGVRVGNIDYPGYPASGLHVDGVTITDPAVHVAFFALLYDQDLNAPMRLYARDEAGNTAEAEFDHRTFPKTFKSSRIDLTDAFLNRVVPAILAGTTEVAPQGSVVDQFVVINRDLRKKNAATIAAQASKTAPEMLWGGVVFHSFANTKVEASFADFRTYTYQGREVDKEVHLGFDLASVANTPIVAANRGKIVWAANLGIYGNCVIIDHGIGVQSLYGHLSSIDVKAGNMVTKGPDDRPQRRNGLGGRRSPALHDARERPSGESERMVGSALDSGPHHAEAARGALRPRPHPGPADTL